MLLVPVAKAVQDGHHIDYNSEVCDNDLDLLEIHDHNYFHGYYGDHSIDRGDHSFDYGDDLVHDALYGHFRNIVDDRLDGIHDCIAEVFHRGVYGH